jgi:hypothetical protein
MVCSSRVLKYRRPRAGACTTHGPTREARISAHLRTFSSTFSASCCRHVISPSDCCTVLGPNPPKSLTRSCVQLIFFRFSTRPTHVSIFHMGFMIIAACVFCVPIYFPAWGGMFVAPREDATEEEYYLRDFTEGEQAAVRCLLPSR